MKKILFVMLILFSIFISSPIYASEIKYDNLITDTSSIEDDFKVLNMDLSNFSKTKEVINKSYIVAYSESLLDNNQIQTYLYLYLSYDTSKELLENFSFNYKLNNIEYTYLEAKKLDSIDNYLFKIKGFKYDYIKNVDLTISLNEMYRIIRESNYAYKEVIIPESKEFNISASHSLLSEDKPFELELAFDSVLVIDEIQLVRVNVQPELFETCSFASWWNTFWDMSNKELYLHFYNFNFPDNIKVDSIEYAKFQYDYVFYEYYSYGKKEELNELSRDNKLKEYIPGTKEFETYNHSGTLEFETFTLGNRITKGEFPDYVGFSDAEKELFNYDASVLLDSSVKKDNSKSLSNFYHSKYYELENVDFIELHYQKDGVVYKCQVISETVGDEPDDKEQVVDGDDPSEKEWWERVWEWFLDNLPYSAITLIAVMILAPVLISLVFGGLGSILKLLLCGILKFIIWLIKLPFIILKFMFGLFKK